MDKNIFCRIVCGRKLEGNARMLNIRETRFGDYEEVARLLKVTDLIEPGERWFTEELFDRMLQRNRGLFFVAERQGKVVGSVFTSHDGGYFGYIYKLAVLPSYRRGGIGAALLQRAVENLRSIPIEWIFAHVGRSNTFPRSLFARFGLTPHTAYELIDNDPK